MGTEAAATIKGNGKHGKMFEGNWRIMEGKWIGKRGDRIEVHLVNWPFSFLPSSRVAMRQNSQFRMANSRHCPQSEKLLLPPFVLSSAPLHCSSFLCPIPLHCAVAILFPFVETVGIWGSLLLAICLHFWHFYASPFPGFIDSREQAELVPDIPGFWH
jgi:hypothetical protein